MNNIDKCKDCLICTEKEKRNKKNKCKMPVTIEKDAPELYIGKDGFLHPIK